MFSARVLSPQRTMTPLAAEPGETAAEHLAIEVVGTEPAAGEGLRLSVPRGQVPAVLRLLADAGAADITCTPARLEDLFLRHYQVAAR